MTMKMCGVWIYAFKAKLNKITCYTQPNNTPDVNEPSISEITDTWKYFYSVVDENDSWL